jgi:hypothetical protein
MDKPHIDLLIGSNPAGRIKKQVVVFTEPLPASFLWYARQDSNLRPTDSKSRNLKNKKGNYYN